MHAISLAEAAHLLGMTADQVRRRAQAGGLERAEPIAGKQAVTFRSVAALAAELGRGLDDGTPIDLGDFAELQDAVTKYHVLGIEREVFLRQLEADALEREQAGQFATAAVLWQLAHGLKRAVYAWQHDRGAWQCTVPGLGTVETMPTRADATSTAHAGEADA